MKPIHWILLVISLFIASLFSWESNSHLPLRVFRRTGEVSLGGTKIFSDTITPSTSNAFSIDISPAGFASPPRVQILPMKNTADPNLVPNIAIKSITSTEIVVNITSGNSNTTTILGISVLSGAPIIFAANPETILLNVQAVGN